jgi:hypothetical protein
MEVPERPAIRARKAKMARTVSCFAKLFGGRLGNIFTRYSSLTGCGCCSQWLKLTRCILKNTTLAKLK